MGVCTAGLEVVAVCMGVCTAALGVRSVCMGVDKEPSGPLVFLMNLAVAHL